MTNLPAIIEQPSANRDRLMPIAPDRDTKYRIGSFIEWLDKDETRTWQQPDMAGYRDHLLDRGLQPSTVQTHLSTIRGRYSALLSDNAVRDDLLAMTPDNASAADRKSFVDEMLTRLENSVKPAASKVKVTSKQDRADSEHLRLTADQAEALIGAPDTDTLIGLRDTAVIALMLCTGLREFELCALQVSDLREKMNGVLSVRVRSGKGAKARLIPYGQQEWVLRICIQPWLVAAGITGGHVFRGFYKAKSGTLPLLRTGALSVRAVQYLLADYPITIAGEEYKVKPHDLRRTFARRCYESGMDMEQIRQNLGHADIKTTQIYIGTLGAEQRKPPSLYRQPQTPKLFKQASLAEL